MTTKPIATSYDEIVRATVPNPDGSFRPSHDQVADAARAPAERAVHQMSTGEQQLYARVVDALLVDPALNASGVRVDVEGTRVILSGGVGGATMVMRTEQIVAAVAGVTAIDNHLSPVPPAPRAPRAPSS